MYVYSNMQYRFYVRVFVLEIRKKIRRTTVSRRVLSQHVLQV